MRQQFSNAFSLIQLKISLHGIRRTFPRLCLTTKELKLKWKNFYSFAFSLCQTFLYFSFSLPPPQKASIAGRKTKEEGITRELGNEKKYDGGHTWWRNGAASKCFDIFEQSSTIEVAEGTSSEDWEEKEDENSFEARWTDGEVTAENAGESQKEDAL